MPKPTIPLLKMVSTKGGMRRILKRRLPVPKYIELAVKAGTYKTPSIRPNYLGLHDDPNKLSQLGARQREEQRVKLRRGVLDYPEEYEILSMNPPLPLPPRTPVRVRKKIVADEKKRIMQKKKEKKKLELLGLLEEEEEEIRELPGMDELVKAFLRRHEEKASSGNVTASKREQEYYATLLLGKDTSTSKDSDSAMGRKSQLVENAYAFALRQQQVLLQGDVKGMQDSAAKVEELLEMEARANRQEGHGISQEIKKWRDENNDGDFSNEDANSSLDSLPSILHSKPRSIRALSIWSARLRSIPYHRWNIGATTALDHWIAREVLGMDENTWSLILEGGGADVSKLNILNGGESRGGLIDRMRHVVVTRESLFPETVAGATGVADASSELMSDLEDKTNESINALLASLGSFDDDLDDEFNFDDNDTTENESEKEPIEAIMDELQVWREKNISSPYESWEQGMKEEFDKWIEKYVSALSSESSNAEIDMEATRNTLLSQPPIDRARSKDFWNKIRTETEAENFLQDYRSNAENKLSYLADSTSLTDEDKILQSELEAIMSIPYDHQLSKLVKMGSLRPILDDYIEESDRQNFLEKYSSIFLEGLELECLVPDPNGPIQLEDLGPSLHEEFAAMHPQDQRFAISKIPYGTDEFGTERAQRARDLYRLWNEHKSNRARFEESMFRKGFMHLEEKKVEKRKKNVEKKKD